MDALSYLAETVVDQNVVRLDVRMHHPQMPDMLQA
jgi:hypothetical protein